MFKYEWPNLRVFCIRCTLFILCILRIIFTVQSIILGPNQACDMIYIILYIDILNIAT